MSVCLIHSHIPKFLSSMAKQTNAYFPRSDREVDAIEGVELQVSINFVPDLVFLFPGNQKLLKEAQSLTCSMYHMHLISDNVISRA